MSKIVKFADLWTKSGMYVGARPCRQRAGKLEICVSGRWIRPGVNIGRILVFVARKGGAA